jgi:hypothetical protein
MAHIQMTDRNPSDLESMEELTDGELLAINGGISLHTPLPRIQISHPSIYITPPSIRITHPSIYITPPSIRITPPSIRIPPPSIRVF